MSVCMLIRTTHSVMYCMLRIDSLSKRRSAKSIVTYLLNLNYTIRMAQITVIIL